MPASTAQLNPRGEWFRQRRVAAGFATQGALADAAGCSQATISRMENGKPTFSPYTRQIAHALNISRDELEDRMGSGGVNRQYRVSRPSQRRRRRLSALLACDPPSPERVTVVSHVRGIPPSVLGV